MICNTKTEFLTNLRIALENNNVADPSDILTDFRQHFDDGAAAGESEAEVCAKLGDIDEIIKQYISEQPQQAQSTGGAMPDTSGFESQGAAEQPYSQPRYAPPPQPQQFEPKAGKIVGVICLDTFLYVWALPALLGLIIALISIAFTFSLIGVISFVAGIVGIFTDISGLIVTGLLPVSLVFFGLMMASFGGMLVIASISSVKGFINLCIAIINQHVRAFAGHNILNKIGKRQEAAI